ncbi:MAG: AI-2E family transporter [Fimbriimonadaceae bacterium]
MAFSWRGVLAPFVLAWLIAVLLEPVVQALGKAKVKRPIAVGIITFAFFGGTALIGFWAFPRIANQINQLRVQVQDLSTDIAKDTANDNVFVRWNPAVRAQERGPLGTVDGYLEKYRPQLEQVGLPVTRRAFAEQYITPYREDFATTARNIFNGIVNFLGMAASQVVLLGFTPIFVIFLMMDLPNFRQRFRNWIPPSIRAGILDMLEDIGGVFQSYLRGLIINISMYMATLAIVLGLLGAPYSYLIAIVAGCLYIIPNLGGILSLITLFLVTGFSGVHKNMFFEVGTSWIFAVILALVFFTITTTWDMLVTPRVVGKSVKLHPFVGMFVVFCGGALAGLPGMMLAYPVAGVVKISLERILNITNRDGKKKLRLPAVPLRHQSTD